MVEAALIRGLQLLWWGAEGLRGWWWWWWWCWGLRRNEGETAAEQPELSDVHDELLFLPQPRASLSGSSAASSAAEEQMFPLFSNRATDKLGANLADCLT